MTTSESPVTNSFNERHETRAVAQDLLANPLTCSPGEVLLGEKGLFAVHGDPMSPDALGQTFTFGRGAHARVKSWLNSTKPLDKLAELLSNHVESVNKDGPAVMCGELIGKARVKQAVRTMCMIGLDIDGGTSLDEAKAALADFRHLAFLNTTFNHDKRSTGIPHRAFDSFALKHGMPTDSDFERLAVGRAFLLEKGYRADLLTSATYAGLEQTAEGRQHFIAHASIDKFRIYLPGIDRFAFIDHGRTEEEAWRRWEDVLLSLASKLNLTICAFRGT